MNGFGRCSVLKRLFWVASVLATVAAGPLCAQPAITVVSAASYRAGVAPDSIASLFGTGLASATQGATSIPLPTTLAGATVRVKDNVGTERVSSLFFVSSTQINFLVPAQTSLGTATVTVDGADGQKHTGTTTVASIAPAIFSADASGAGPAAALVVKADIDGSQFSFPVARLDAATSKLVAVPISFGSASQNVVLTLYGTGLRSRSALSAVTVKVGNANCTVAYAGAQSSYAGLDQVNANLPRSLAGAGQVQVDVTVNGKAANPVSIVIGDTHLPPTIGSVAPNTAEAMAFGTTVSVFGSDLADVTQAVITPATGTHISTPRILPDHVETTASLDPGTTAGLRAIYLVTPRGVTNQLPLTITRSAPVIRSASPSSLQQGEWASVLIDGDNLFDPNVKINFSPTTYITGYLSGIIQTGDNPQVVEVVWVDPQAAVGTRSVAVTTSAGTSNSLPFAIVPKTGNFTIIAGGLQRDYTDPSLVHVGVYLTDPSGAAYSGKTRYVFAMNQYVIFGSDDSAATPYLNGQYYREYAVRLPSRLAAGMYFFRVGVINSLNQPSNVANGTANILF